MQKIFVKSGCIDHAMKIYLQRGFALVFTSCMLERLGRMNRIYPSCEPWKLGVTMSKEGLVEKNP